MTRSLAAFMTGRNAGNDDRRGQAKRFEETEHFWRWRQQEVAKIVQCGESRLDEDHRKYLSWLSYPDPVSFPYDAICTATSCSSNTTVSRQ